LSQNQGRDFADAHWVACGRSTRGTCTRVQSRPSISAANCAAESRITPSVIGGHLNAPWRANTFEEKAQLCAACHGENGIPPDKSTPVIWGQHQGYLYLQLRDYKRGTRKDDVMSPVVDLLERDDMMALAEYFSHKRWPDLRQPPAPPAVAARARRLWKPSMTPTKAKMQKEFRSTTTRP
jgi:cytochrome c553